MDEQRMQAYMELIEQLLGCSQVEEGALLQANAELVDAELVAVMGQVADMLGSQGNGNAGWLRQFAAQLAQTLGLVEGSPSSSSSEDAAAFALEIVQLIAQAGAIGRRFTSFFGPMWGDWMRSCCGHCQTYFRC
jgi:hypothetical protein